MNADSETFPIACNLAAVSDRTRYRTLLERLRVAMSGLAELPDGYPIGSVLGAEPGGVGRVDFARTSLLPLPAFRDSCAFRAARVRYGTIEGLMNRRFLQVLVFLLVLLHVAGALFETVDRWDGFAQGGDDLVLTVLSAAVCVALSFLLGLLLPKIAGHLTKFLEFSGLTNSCEPTPLFFCLSRVTLFPGSPPPLRI